MTDGRMAKLFCDFLSVQEDYRERSHIAEDLKEAGATKAELEWFGYDDYVEEEEK